MDTWKDFISDLGKIELLRLAREEAVEEWGVDIPKTLLFSKLGKAIAEKFDDFSLDERVFVFNTIELSMKTASDDLRALIATGLLESMYTRASRDTALWEHICGLLGDVTKQYLHDWGSWSQS